MQFSETPDAIGGMADWWRGAVIYQIYPRSFQDSNADGTGDLKGITRRLPYVASLGVDAIWISPFFKSPMADFGYDVTDYCDVDPTFGTLDDFDQLIGTAHGLGLKVMIDQVISHTSDQHPWFAESRQNRTNEKADWYVWSDPKDDGTPPNNWLSIFGGSAWQWDARRRQYYLHNFLAQQPDLNYHCPAVQDAVLATVRFWLDRGVDGFRLDTINFYVHDKELRSNPPLPNDLRNASIAPEVNPYNFQFHLYDKNQPENLDFLKRLRALMDEYPDIAAVGEVGDDQKSLELMAEYTSGGDKVHMCYSFDFLSRDPITPKRVSGIVDAFDEAGGDGWACWAMSNHDVERHGSRLFIEGLDRLQTQKVHMALLLSLKGSVCLYQGEELGLGEADIAFEDLQDPYGIEFWPEFKGRDGCRTPMVWGKEEANGGFSDARPWLPVPQEHLALSVDEQEKTNDALLHAYRQFLGFRKQNIALSKGDIEFLTMDESCLMFVRPSKDADEADLLCVFNLSGDAIDVDPPQGSLRPLVGHGFSGELTDGKIVLPAGQAFFAEFEC
ncbi:MAG: alpha-amylase family glycosyl hydrolase [Pseudomonadota bacterium]